MKEQVFMFFMFYRNEGTSIYVLYGSIEMKEQVFMFFMVL